MAVRIKSKSEQSRFFKSSIPMAGSLIAAVYVVFMLVFFPLYLKNGYEAVGDVKYELFYKGTTLFLVAVAVFFPVYGIWKARTDRVGLFTMAGKMLGSISELDRWILLYAGCVSISYLLSPYRTFGWKGADGWWMGFETQFLMMAAYFLISRWLIPWRELWYLHFLGSGGVFFSRDSESVSH